MKNTKEERNALVEDIIDPTGGKAALVKRANDYYIEVFNDETGYREDGIRLNTKSEKVARQLIKSFINSTHRMLGSDYSEEYPIGGMAEPYDIEREKELTN